MREPNRRSFLRSAAALPALAVPAVAITEPALALAVPATGEPDLALIQASCGWEIYRLAYGGLPLDWPEEEVDRHWNCLADLESQIATCPATTLNGVHAKAVVLKRLMEINEEVFPVELGNIVDLMKSIVEDLRLARYDNSPLSAWTEEAADA